MKIEHPQVVISVMLAVPNTPEAVDWYRKALGARLLWSLGSVAGLEIEGAAFFLHEPVQGRFEHPKLRLQRPESKFLWISQTKCFLAPSMQARPEVK